MRAVCAYTGVFRAVGEDRAINSEYKVAKRNGRVLSCNPCRQRKLKCNRAQPCEACIGRSDDILCVYGESARIRDGNAATHNRAQERLARLEQTVRVIADGEAETSDSSAVNKTQMSTARTGPLEQRPDFETRYCHSTHWSSLLDDIQESKAPIGADLATMSASSLEDQGEMERHDGEILIGSSTSHLSLQQILSHSLPPKVQVDRRLSTYFNAKYIILPFIHVGQFQRQYEEFWGNPLKSSPLWVSMLFSICCLAATVSEATGLDPPVPDNQPSPRNHFSTAAAQCLILGRYTRPNRWVVEALVIYAQCKYLHTLDPSREVSLIISILTRLCYRMGYHRDPENCCRMTVFEGEMRRRTWAMVRQFDLMIAFQHGVPNNIPADTWDTKPPRNITDEDLDEDTKVLPPARPENVPTQILYFVTKQRLMVEFHKVCQFAWTFRSISHTELMALDEEIQLARAAIPEVLRLRPMAQSLADLPYVIMVRLNIEFLLQKSLLVLHRRYMTQGNECSSGICMRSAMNIVGIMSDMREEFQPSGQLYPTRWMLSSFAMNDFLLAIMTLCLTLSMWRNRNPKKLIGDDRSALDQFDMLKKSYDMCTETTFSCTESRRVADAVKVVILQIETQNPVYQNQNASRNTGADQLSVSITSSPTSALQESVVQPLVAYPTSTESDRETEDNIFRGFEDFDWTLLDQYPFTSDELYLP